MSYETLITEKSNHTLVIMLNRPKVLNALNRKMLEELDEVIADFKQDPEMKGAVLIGIGDKAFAAGADIAELTALGEAEASKFVAFGQGVFDAIEQSPKPIIAAVNGFALGGGCELAMACHMRIASENARFGQPEVKLGLLPGYGGTQRLPQLIGKGRAIEYLITGNMIKADEALRWGLVNHITTRGELADKCLEILRKAYKQSSTAIGYTLEAVHAAYNNKNGYQTEVQNFGKALKSDDGKEGTAAFLEKRNPNFTGRIGA
ncbi:MAG: enoyl-CoA hydratase-related protein [Bacteroidota bacterium]